MRIHEPGNVGIGRAQTARRATGVLCALSLLSLQAIAEPAQARDIFTPPPPDGPSAPSRLESGNTVRVLGMDGSWNEARFLGASNGELHLASTSEGGGVYVLPEQSTRMQVRGGTKGNGLKGMAVGSVLGLITGVMIGSRDDSGDGWADLYDPLNPFFGGVAGTLLGGLAGGVVGVSIRTPEWHDAYVYSRSSAQLPGTTDPVEFELVLFER